jgi:hypothetical protein
MPRSHKTPGRRARDVARAKASRAREAGKKALRDRVHVSTRSKAWKTASEVRRARRLADARRFEQLGRAGSGQRRSTGPRQDQVARPGHRVVRDHPPGAMDRAWRRQRGLREGPAPGTKKGQ